MQSKRFEKYRVKDPTKGTPAGFAVLSDANDLHASTYLFIPQRLAEAIRREAEAEREELERLHKSWAPERNNQPAPAPAPPPAHGSPPSPPPAPFGAASKRASEHTVKLDHIDAGWPKPRGTGWVKVWDQEALRTRVVAHNEGMGSSDTSDRARDAGMLRRMLADGPWRRCGRPSDIESVIGALETELGPDMPVVRVVADSLTLTARTRRPLHLPPMLLVGAPGAGKTHLARRLAELLGLTSVLVDMSAQQTNSHLHGSDHHWGNARPGILFNEIVLGRLANPVVTLDELDKVSGRGSNRYNPCGPLHMALEPTTARATKDLCAAVIFDASHVIWIATANKLSGIPDSLLSRFRIFHVTPPEPRQALHTARAIAAEVLRTSGLQRTFAPIGRAVLVELADRTPRQVQQLLMTAVTRAVAAGRMHLELRDIWGHVERSH